MYISMDGDKFEDHPGLEGAVESLLATLNREVDEANRAAYEATARAEAEATAYMANLHL